MIRSDGLGNPPRQDRGWTVANMFTAHRNRNMFEAAFTTLSLIYHVTVYNLRKEHRNALIGLLLTILQSSVFILGFFALYLIMGVRHSPIRGDFMIYIMSGIFTFMVFVQTMTAISNVGGSTGGLTKHGPLNTAVLITAAALAVLYRMVVSIIVILGTYHMIFQPITLHNPIGCLAMVLLSWAVGAAIGLVFLALRPWWPQGAKILTQLTQRINMIASGKMFVANALPPVMLQMFDWNPLFHIVDQMRGYAFINYSPRNTSLEYPIYVGIAILMIGLMAEFVTRNSESLSWSAGK